jgi:hypothetical protein
LEVAEISQQGGLAVVVHDIKWSRNILKQCRTGAFFNPGIMALHWWGVARLPGRLAALCRRQTEDI